ncbi:MAG: helix-turn-helix domain-containing protein [Bacteroidota bacterium]
MNADFLLIIGFFEAFFLGILVLTKRQKQISDKLLATILLLNALTIFLSWVEIYNRSKSYPFPALINSSTPFILLHGPLIWLYVKSLTSENFKLKSVHFLHITPFLLVITLLISSTYGVPPEKRILIDSEQLFKEHWSYPLIVAAIFISIQSYIIHSLVHIKQYRKKIKSYFSFIDHFCLRWFRFVLFTAMVFYGAISLTYILDFFFNMLPYHLLQLTGFTIATIYILVLGFFGLRQGNIFTSHNIQHFPEKEEKPASRGPLESTEEKFIMQLLQHMEQQQPHLNPELNLAQLASQLSVTPEYLSGILNGNLNSNFFDFINQYRIDAFKKHCRNQEKQNITLLGIAYECGFNSKATFNRVFKKHTGLTPGEYTKEVSKK